MVTIGGENPSTNRVSREDYIVFREKISSYSNINIPLGEQQMFLHHFSKVKSIEERKYISNDNYIQDVLEFIENIGSYISLKNKVKPDMVFEYLIVSLVSKF